MSHYAIAIYLNDTATLAEIRMLATDSEGRVEIGGPRGSDAVHIDAFKGNADELAARYSRHHFINRVICTHVSETSVGTWREGERS